MTQLSAPMDAALAGAVVMPFGALKISLRTGPVIRLLDSSGVVNFGGDLFSGRDATFGSIMKVDKLTEGVGDNAPALKLSFTPQDSAAATSLASAAMQGSPVRMWVGLVDPASGLAIADPYQVFRGEVDTCTLKGGQAGRSVEIVISSVFERFFLTNDGARLSDTFHKYVWPGEEGMSFMTYITHQIYWGGDAPSGVTT